MFVMRVCAIIRHADLDRLTNLAFYKVSSSSAVRRKDIVLAINDLVFLFSIMMPPTKIPHAISSLEMTAAIKVNESSTTARRDLRHALWGVGCLPMSHGTKTCCPPR
ncbi:hypothetical protein ACLOJK_020031 [Asimina triloba]